MRCGKARRRYRNVVETQSEMICRFRAGYHAHLRQRRLLSILRAQPRPARGHEIHRAHSRVGAGYLPSIPRIAHVESAHPDLRARGSAAGWQRRLAPVVRSCDRRFQRRNRGDAGHRARHHQFAACGARGAGAPGGGDASHPRRDPRRAFGRAGPRAEPAIDGDPEQRPGGTAAAGQDPGRSRRGARNPQRYRRRRQAGGRRHQSASCADEERRSETASRSTSTISRTRCSSWRTAS